MKTSTQYILLLCLCLLAPGTLAQDKPAYEQRDQPVTQADLPSTQFKDIKRVLKMALERVAARLKAEQRAK